MKNIRLPFLFSISLILVLSNLFSVRAEPPTRAKIAFVSSGVNPEGRYQSNIYMTNPDGSDLVNLISRSGGINQIAWEPTGKRILFCSDREGIHDIYVMNVDGTDVRPMFTQRRYKREPAWSPDSKWIAYTSPSPTVGWSIYFAPIDGQSGEPIVQVGHRGGQPDWSPDGTEIVFVVASVGIREIYILNLETHTQRLLLPDKNPWMYRPAWSPDGKRIAFAWSPEKAGIGIYVVNRDGTGLEEVVAPSTSRILSITWAPSGNELIYGKIMVNTAHLFKVSLQDRRIQQFTDEMPSAEAIWFDPAAVVPVEPSASAFITTWGKIKNKD